MRTQMSDRDTLEHPSARKEGYLALAVEFPAALLRRLQTWLWPSHEEAPSSGRITPSYHHQEDRRKLVAVKQVDNFSLATRVYRCALYALTDTLDDIGVTVALLEHAKGTLHVSGDKSIDCSPVKERSETSPPLKRGMEDSEDEDEDLNLQEQLDRSYDSEDDEDYQPPSDEGVSTDSDSYKEGETESEQSELEEEQVRDSLLPARRSGKLPSGIKKSPADGISGAYATGSKVKGAAGTPGEGTAEPSAEGTVQLSAGDTVQPVAAQGSTDPTADEGFSGQEVDAEPPSKTDSEPADPTTGQPSKPSASPAGVAADAAPSDVTAETLPQKMGDGQDVGESGHVPTIDQAKTKMPPSARTP